ncbi:MAG: S-layer related protein (Precursor) [Planctomycetaceae bacterium]|nr:S-layer related protein (Precursor) [Planctomycetaceae bacterium]
MQAVVTLAFTTHVLTLAHANAEELKFRVVPQQVKLNGHFEQSQLVVNQVLIDDAPNTDIDKTRLATYVSDHPEIVAVDKYGRLLAVANGSATVKVTIGPNVISVPVEVTGVDDKPKLEFGGKVAPILSKAGCNMGACHASQYGKGGFKLSVFGFQPSQDRSAIVRDSHQRRVNFNDPSASLLLRKPTMEAPHGGGKRLERDSVDYKILEAWIADGAPRPDSKAPKVTSINVFPKSRTGTQGLRQQLRVDATYSDGSIRDVTAWAKYDTMDDAVVNVSPSGYVTAIGRGQAPVMVRFEGQAEISMYVIPYADNIKLAAWTNNNFVDELAEKKFRSLGIEPSPLCDDATFIRRAFLDATGTIPKLEETKAFIENQDPQKREKLIDRLLGLTGDPKLDIYNDAYAAFWTLKWSDLLKNSSGGGGRELAMWSMHNWIKEAFRTNKPFDQFVKELVTAKGSVYMSGPANYFRINANSSALTESTAQLFMGIRLECAKCHHHPFEKHSQDDYYGFAAFFARVSSKRSEEFGLFGGDSVVMVQAGGSVRNPRTGKTMEPTPLDGEPKTHPLDLRIPLAEWLTSKDNKFFAKSIVNRYFGYLMGRGLVEPIDDMRSTNPPSNVELMNALAKHFVDSDFDLKQLIRTIMVSRLYQLDSQPTESNASDRRFYSHYKVKRLSAEPLLDAIDVVTASPTKFKNLPKGTKAIELPDAEYPNYFLKTFAKPKRASVCECERSPDENLAQALHTLNGDILAAKIADVNGRIANLLKAKKSHEECVTEIYLATLCRRPSGAEMKASHEFLKESPSPTEFYQDLMWALVNSKQFLFVR